MQYQGFRLATGGVGIDKGAGMAEVSDEVGAARAYYGFLTRDWIAAAFDVISKLGLKREGKPPLAI